MSEEENERDFMKTCFNVVAGLEVKNESQAIAKEVILDEVENLTKENIQLKEVIEEVREYVNHEWFKRGQLGIIDKSFQEWQLKELLQILDKVKENNNE